MFQSPLGEGGCRQRAVEPKKFPGQLTSLGIPIDGCNERVCIWMLPMSPLVSQRIKENRTPTISYVASTAVNISVAALSRLKQGFDSPRERQRLQQR
jgi:hypothetical protein